MRRLASFLLLGVVWAFPATAQQDVWELDGSLVQISTQGSTTRILFQSATGLFYAQGANAGALLFEGRKDGLTFAGLAYAFSAGCLPESYEAKGAMTPDGATLRLTGRIPFRDHECAIKSYSEQTLVLTRKQAAPPPPPPPPPSTAHTSQPAQPVQTSRPSSPREQCAVSRMSGATERYCASSVLSPQLGNTYGVANLFAGRADQAWVEGQAGSGAGEWVVVAFDAPRRITAFMIDNGYQKNIDIYQKNARVRTLDVVYSNGQRDTIPLQDQMGSQRINLGAPVVASWVQFIIRDVYRGSRYTDTAISKLSVQSRPAN